MLVFCLCHDLHAEALFLCIFFFRVGLPRDSDVYFFGQISNSVNSNPVFMKSLLGIRQLWFCSLEEAWIFSNLLSSFDPRSSSHARHSPLAIPIGHLRSREYRLFSWNRRELNIVIGLGSLMLQFCDCICYFLIDGSWSELWNHIPQIMSAAPWYRFSPWLW